MKRTVILILLVVAILTMVPATVSATEPDVPNIIYFDDGSYLTVEISVDAVWSTKVRKSKVFTYCDVYGNEEWHAELIGIFNYDGTTVTTTSCICNVTITDTSWSYTKKRCYVDGGSALCDLVMVKTVAGVTVRTIEQTLSLTCSPTGEFS